MLSRIYRMLVISPLVALAMLMRPALMSTPRIIDRRAGAGSPGRRPRKASRYYTPNGLRECARRRRQIANGQLRVSA
ncbi:MAG: hypothetical protein ACOY3N_23430 [Bradyrhizobium sp.]|uniref:hypothetical protein n=1 Tax=Bradyrhizobium sp. TaxID=376 RepID=UPI003BF288BF